MNSPHVSDEPSEDIFLLGLEASELLAEVFTGIMNQFPLHFGDLDLSDHDDFIAWQEYFIESGKTEYILSHNKRALFIHTTHQLQLLYAARWRGDRALIELVGIWAIPDVSIGC